MSETSSTDQESRPGIDSAHQERLAEQLYSAVSSDAFDLLGLKNRPRVKRIVEPFFRPLGLRFTNLLVDFELDTSMYGFQAAVGQLLPRFIGSVETHGNELLPSSGPLLLASNHPAAYDALLLAAALPRDDLKILATDVQLVKHMPASSEHFIFIGPAGRPDRFLRMSAVRKAIRHLRGGGALLIFPGGLVDPDPALSTEGRTSLANWHPSLGLFLRNVRQCSIVFSIVSGVLSKRWLNSPITRLRREPHNRQKVAEVFQLFEQLLFPGRLLIDPKISFSRPYQSKDLIQFEKSALMAQLIGYADRLFVQHIEDFYADSS